MRIILLKVFSSLVFMIDITFASNLEESLVEFLFYEQLVETNIDINNLRKDSGYLVAQKIISIENFIIESKNLDNNVYVNGISTFGYDIDLDKIDFNFSKMTIGDWLVIERHIHNNNIVALNKIYDSISSSNDFLII